MQSPRHTLLSLSPLQDMREAGAALGLTMHVHGPESDIVDIVPLALGVEVESAAEAADAPSRPSSDESKESKNREATMRPGEDAAPAAITRLWAPTDGAQRDGAIGRAVRRRNAATHAQPHLGCRPRRGKTPTAQQRGRRPLQILAARASPSRW